jgi:predicted DNA binding CopG/RHH family protein
MEKKKYISAEKLDKLFDDGKEDALQHFDTSNIMSAKEAGEKLGFDWPLKPKRVNVDFPPWMIKRLDEEASKLGLARQAVIKFFLAEKLGYNPQKPL